MKKFMQMPQVKFYKTFFVSLLTLFLLLSGCRSGGLAQIGSPDASVSFEIIEKGVHSNFISKIDIVLTDQNELNTIYDTINSTITPKNEIPQIDFSEYQVVISCMGEKSTGGYSMDIDSIMNVEEELVVYLKYNVPKPGEMVTTALTSPYLIYTFKKQSKPIRFQY